MQNRKKETDKGKADVSGRLLLLVGCFPLFLSSSFSFLLAFMFQLLTPTFVPASSVPVYQQPPPPPLPPSKTVYQVNSRKMKRAERVSVCCLSLWYAASLSDYSHTCIHGYECTRECEGCVCLCVVVCVCFDSIEPARTSFGSRSRPLTLSLSLITEELALVLGH